MIQFTNKNLFAHCYTIPRLPSNSNNFSMTIKPIDAIPARTTISSLNGPRSNVIEGVLHIPQTSRTGVSITDRIQCCVQITIFGGVVLSLSAMSAVGWRIRRLHLCRGVNSRSATSVPDIDRLWKYDRSDKIKQEFFQVVAVSILLYACSTRILLKQSEKWQNRS